jgi:polygalacturonase
VKRSLIAAALLGPAAAFAQDTRTVTEPVRPAACAVLTAALTPVADSTLPDRDERALDTDRIQRAIDGCRAGRAVVLRAEGTRRAFLSGPLTLRSGVTLVVDTNTILFASRDPLLFDLEAGRCGTVDEKGHACKPLISGTRASHSGVMGPGTIDGRGWATLLGQPVSWWDLAQEAKVRNQNQSCPRLVVMSRSDDFTLYALTLRNSPNFHVVYEKGNGFTAWGVIIDTPRGARNTDGIDPSASANVTITRSFIRTGDDNVAIKAGGPELTHHITISHNHFYTGHGVSIGSETNGGAKAVRVFDLTIDGADNGLRIKSNASRGGLVEDIEYRDVCIRNTKNAIEMDTHYTASAQTTGTLIPRFRDIRLQDVRVLSGNQVILEGYDDARPLDIRFDNVYFDDPTAFKLRAAIANVAISGGSNFPLKGDRVRVTGTKGTGTGTNCDGRFVPMPARGRATPAADRPAAVVDARYRGAEGDSIAGVPTFRSIGGALTAQAVNGSSRTVILVRNGRYREKLTVDRPRITLRGESRDSTILTFDAAADTPTPTGGTYGTRGSHTLRIVAPDFKAEEITIENAFDYTANAAKADSDKTKLRNAQAVALMLDLGSDRAFFSHVRITGYQDTLFPNSGRAYFWRSEISGNVDFIFGAGQAVFEECDIISRDRHSATNNGYVTAASTRDTQPYGFLFLRSRLSKERPTMAANSVTLGRPWHPFADPRAVASVAFVDCWMDDHIGERGWDRMSSVDSTGTRIWYEPISARFGEAGTTGPGAVKSAGRRVLSAAEAARWTPAAVLEGWVPLPSAGGTR